MGRLIVVSNRLSFSLVREGDELTFSSSSGGLATALTSYIERRRAEDPSFECLWVGWPGSSVAKGEQEEVRRRALAEHRAYPVFMSDEDIEAFYNGFSNSTLWPLFHYFPSYTHYDEDQFSAYCRANEVFAEAVLEVARPGDVVWVHDYQLLLVPNLLRKRSPALSIGFFLHIPFPSFEVFRLLPTRWRREILEGMLGADLVGFHTHDYTQYFLRSVFRTLGYEHHLGQIAMLEGVRRAETFPLGIDYDKFMEAAKTPEVAAIRARFEAELHGRDVIFSVDRLDYSKGLVQRLRGYEAFLEAHPERRGRVVFILVVVPSRTSVERYQLMKQELDEVVGRINGSYGSVDWVPILYQYRTLEFMELVALYSLAPVALITPLRDGMNLVAKEYLASKPDGRGTLILSEMAGAARELGEALQVNPNHRSEIADALEQALAQGADERGAEEQVASVRLMQERLRRYDAGRWATNFLATLDRVKHRQGALATRHLRGSVRQSAVRRFQGAKRRLILLDYDGTLVPFAPAPHLAVPDRELLDTVGTLAAHPETLLYLISGRDRQALDSWFRDVPIGIIAEHGAWMRGARGDWGLIKPLAFEWKAQLRPHLEFYVDRVPGSLLEEKDYSLAWHYRRADPELGASAAKELIDDLVSYTANLDVQVLEGKKVVELRNSGVNKGVAALHCVALHTPDLVLAAGDDQTDEDLFRVLPEQTLTIRVGTIHSHATYHVTDHREMRSFLRELTQSSDPTLA
ncbi:MAG TPA: bifunctional alpha,alpha-trehalose-phosphate synthase (UDP-forming)/trehalose-phosphatase [Polyangiaceae bacterium]|nr:bifunctional alpha,alpha-trehalose-phosphate synthase (UDP-forming)/trehalose-phosphatase [Polyangiaceae bacterium]